MARTIAVRASVIFRNVEDRAEMLEFWAGRERGTTGAEFQVSNNDLDKFVDDVDRRNVNKITIELLGK